MDRVNLWLITIAAIVYSSAAEIRLIGRSATTLEWNLASVLTAGKKYSVEVLFNAPTGNVRVIDELLRPGQRTYKAINLRSNKLYQVRVYPRGQKGKGGETISEPVYTNLRCYACNAALSVDFCTKVIECPTTVRQCYSRVRYFSGNNRFGIYKGCKTSTDVWIPNQERLALTKTANAEVKDLTTEEVLETMPGLKFFGDVEKLLQRSPAIRKQVKKKFAEKKKLDLENALKRECSGREDPNYFCRCSCDEERCNHAMLDCGVSQPPDYREEEPLPPDIATTSAARTFPTRPPRKIAPVCRDFNGGCDHICISLNKTTARCECYENYKLGKDGKTCTTHLKHAVADAGPDITITLPQNSITLTANRTKGSVRRYKWWDPVASGTNPGLTLSDTTRRELHVSNLREGQYKFILMVTGMDGRRTSDVMTLTVKANPGSVDATEEPTTRSKRPRPRVMSYNRYRSMRHRNRWKAHVKANGLKTTPPTPSRPLLRFSTTPRSFTIIKRPGLSNSSLIPEISTRLSGRLRNPATTSPTAKKVEVTSIEKRNPTENRLSSSRSTAAAARQTPSSTSGTRHSSFTDMPASTSSTVRPTSNTLLQSGNRGQRVNSRGRAKTIGRGRRGSPAKPKSAWGSRGSSRGRRLSSSRSKFTRGSRTSGRGRGSTSTRSRRGSRNAVRGRGRSPRRGGSTGARRRGQNPTRRSHVGTKPPPTPAAESKRAAVPKPQKTPGSRRTTVAATSVSSTTLTTTTERSVQCPTFTSLEERHVLATCTNANMAGSECQFECQGQRTLKGGSSSATCGLFEARPAWMNGQSPTVLPCCELGCPGNAFADLIFLIHSNTKTGRADWSRILKFVNSMVAEYTFGDSNVCVGAVRYHRIADARHEVGLDCSRSKAAFKQALLKMPFAGIGSNTAAGLTHLRMKSFKASGNRPKAPDVAVVITDSRSTGDVRRAAKALKVSGVKIHVIGLKTRSGSPDLTQMRTMASFPAKVPNIPRIPQSATPVLKSQLRSFLCVKGCERYISETDAVRVAKPKRSGR